MRESEGEGYDFNELPETLKDVEFPKECPECGASNPDNSDQCGSCEAMFKPVEKEEEQFAEVE